MQFNGKYKMIYIFCIIKLEEKKYSNMNSIVRVTFYLYSLKFTDMYW